MGAQFLRVRRPKRALDTLKAMSEIFGPQVFATFIDDSWPHSRDVISRCLAGVAPAAQERLGWKNCAALYGLDTSALPPAPAP